MNKSEYLYFYSSVLVDIVGGAGGEGVPAPEREADAGAEDDLDESVLGGQAAEQLEQLIRGAHGRLVGAPVVRE